MSEETTPNDSASTESSSATPVTPADAQTETPVSTKPPAPEMIYVTNSADMSNSTSRKAASPPAEPADEAGAKE